MLVKVVLIGKNSYIGEHLTNFLQTRGIVVVALSSSDCNFLQFDKVAEKFDSLGNSQISIVFLAVIKKNASNNYQTYHQNITLINNLIKVTTRTNISSIVYLSSVDVYGTSPILPITEQTKIDPDSWYGLAKYSCERMLLLSENVNFPITILRIPGIFGKSHSDASVIGKMIASAISDGRIIIKGKGDALRDYVCLNDLSEIILLILNKKYQGILNVATGESRSILDIAKCIGRELNIKIEIINTEKDERSFNLVFDNSKIKEILPNFSFTEMPFAIADYSK
jgi:nucleoside-diphosphate-sugar epimerase